MKLKKFISIITASMFIMFSIVQPFSSGTNHIMASNEYEDESSNIGNTTGDFNANGLLDLSDLNAFYNCFFDGSIESEEKLTNEDLDFNGDGKCSIVDLCLMKSSVLSKYDEITEDYQKIEEDLSTVVYDDSFVNSTVDKQKNLIEKELNNLALDGIVIDGSIDYQKENNIIWYEWGDGYKSCIIFNELNNDMLGCANSDSFIKKWEYDGKTFNIELNQKIDYDSSYPFYENDIINLNLKANYMMGVTEYSETTKKIKLNKEIWSNNHLNTILHEHPTVEDYRTKLKGYDFVVLQAHATILNNEPVFIVDGNDSIDINIIDMAEHLISTVRYKERNGSWKKAWLIHPDFFLKYYGDNGLEDTIIWLSMCEGYKNPQLVDALQKCGAKAVVGYTESVHADYDYYLQSAFVYSLLYGDNVNDALNYSKHLFYYTDNQWLKSIGVEYKWYESKTYRPAEAKANLKGENKRLINLIEKDQSNVRNFQISFFAHDDEGLPLTNNEISVSLSNEEISCLCETKTITTIDGSVIFDFQTNSKLHDITTDITINIPGYEDFVVNNYVADTSAYSINLCDLVFLNNFPCNSKGVYNIYLNPSYLKRYNGHTYYFYDKSFSYAKAKDFCSSIGGHLVTISDENEQAFLEEALISCDKYHYWIGLQRINNTWQWLDGTPFNYTNWAINEPNNDSSYENYVHLYGKTYEDEKKQYDLNGINILGEWNDIADDRDSTKNKYYSLENFGFICEWDNDDSIQQINIADRLLGTWTGTYSGTADAKLITRAITFLIDQCSDTGDFSGLAIIDEGENGEYIFNGNINAKTNTLSICGSEWLNNCSNFVFSEFIGNIDWNNETMSGHIGEDSERIFNIKKTAGVDSIDSIKYSEIPLCWKGEYDGYSGESNNIVRRNIVLKISDISDNGEINGVATISQSEKSDSEYAVELSYDFKGIIDKRFGTIEFQGIRFVDDPNGDSKNFTLIRFYGHIKDKIINGRTEYGIWTSEENIIHETEDNTSTYVDLNNIKKSDVKKFCEKLLSKEVYSISNEEILLFEQIKENVSPYGLLWYLKEVVDLNEILYGAIDSKSIKSIISTHDDEETFNKAKYLVICGWPSSLISKCFMINTNVFSCESAKEAFLQFDDDQYMAQGNFKLFDFEVQTLDNGEINFSFEARQNSVSPCDGAVLVYDNNGDIVNYIKLKKYERPDSFGSFVDKISEMEYTKTEVNVNIPIGGFIEITDDPERIEDVALNLRLIDEVHENKIDLNIINSLTDNAPNLSNPLDILTLTLDTVEGITKRINDFEANYWSEKEILSGSLIFHNVQY